MKRKAFALILSLIVVVVLAIVGAVMLSRSISESRLAQRELESAQAFWAAEAGVNKALYELKQGSTFDNESAGTNKWPVSLTQGGYSIGLGAKSGNSRTVTVSGYFPATSPTMTRKIEVVVSKPPLPPNLFDHAIYTSGDLTSNGAAGSVTGNIIVGGTFTDNGGTTMGTPTIDSSINPIARLNFGDLEIASIAQNNDYETSKNGKKYYEPGTTTEKALPGDFWYTTADDGVDNDGDDIVDEADEWVPNIVYIDGDIDISGSGTVGGFFIVGGDMIADATLGGSGILDGIIYMLGELAINGGGGEDTLNINGGILAGGNTTLNGNPTIEYNSAYMNAIKNNTPVDSDPGINSWKDISDS
ncbi:MAG: hypothetical protein HQ570_01190 [Candidatus Omnitrophica bacterium]|nr:hypothetical protein [Candidatus Omnitrophota bacterium]